MNQSLQATPSLIMADGTVVKLTPITLDPAGVALVNITDALKHLPAPSASHRSEYGMARVEYSWAWPGAVMATIQNVDETAMLSLHSALQSDMADANALKQKSKQQYIEGAWWRPYASTDMFLFLGNSSGAAKRVSVEVRSETGATIARTELIVAPHGSTKIKPLDLLASPPAVGATGSLRIRATGSDRSLVTIGGLEDLTNGFSETLHLSEAHPENLRTSSPHPLTLATPGVLFGLPQPDMQFPAGTTFAPYLIVHNASKAPRVLSLSATYTQAGQVIVRPLGTLALAAGETRPFDFSQITGKSPAQPDKGSIQLTESFSGSEEDLQVETGSVDQTGNYVFEAESHYEEATISRTICYWSTFTDTNTMVSLWNYKGNAQDLVLTLFYRGGKYELPIHLAAGADLDLDIASLVRKHVPDSHGHVIPTNVTEGSAMLASADGMQAKLEVASSTSTFNVRNGTCANQCGTCNGVTDGYVSPSPINLTIGGRVQAIPYFKYNTGETIQVSAPTWSTGSIASITSDGFVTGKSSGQTSTSFYVDNVQNGVGYICTGNSFFCPSSRKGGSSSTNVSIIPAHMVVANDPGSVQGNVCSNAAQNGKVRSILYQLQDAGGHTGASLMQENFSSASNNTCGNGNATPTACRSTIFSDGTFTDRIATNYCSPTQGNSCGFSIAPDHWQYCGDGNSLNVGSPTYIVTWRDITINGAEQIVTGSVIP